MTLSVLSLFSGIGAMDLGLERTGGFKTCAFVEIDPFCRRVLAKHWPGVPQYDDVRTLTAERLRADGIAVDVICGGFPCQDISVAGQGVGIEGERSGLWSEFARLIGEIRPRYVLVENVAALLGRGMGRVLGDLSALRYDAEWDIISAADMGAPHRRERVWIVAYPEGRGARCGRDGPDALALHGGAGEGGQRGVITGLGLCAHGIAAGVVGPWGADWEDGIPRVAHGVPDRVSRLKALGNSLVPQIPQMLGEMILAVSAPRR
jgi:DNA (cytosine-5)-methyltransferase 1